MTGPSRKAADVGLDRSGDLEPSPHRLSDYLAKPNHLQQLIHKTDCRLTSKIISVDCRPSCLRTDIAKRHVYVATLGPHGRCKKSCRLHFNSAEDAYLKARAPSMAMSIFRHWNLECYPNRGFHPGALGECPEPEAALQLRRQGDAA